MRIRLGDLRSLIAEAVLLEYEVQPGVRLYHRSPTKFKVGDVLTAQRDPKTGQHWLSDNKHEKDLESYRQRYHPELPSRFECVYASFVPHSRFVRKGHLYVIEPIGKVFVTNSKLIDEMSQSRYGSFDLVEQYWEGVEPHRTNLADLEALMPEARVVEVIEEKERLKFGDTIEFKEGAPIVHTKINYYRTDPKYADPGDDLRPYAYLEDGFKTVFIGDMLKIVSSVPGMKVLDKPKLELTDDDYGNELRVELGPGFVGKLRSLSMEEPGKNKKFRHSRMTISPVDGGPSMFVENIELGKVHRAIRSGTIVRRGE